MENPVRIIARFIKYHKLLSVFILFLIIILYYSFFGSNGYMKRVKLENEKNELENQLKTELKKQDSLKNLIEELKTSDKKIEEVAREKHKMTKDGEKILNIVIDSTK